ncbi:MAG: hypothetical protein U9Q03_01680 [Patescibacteria group bacterium]|nr:hypothetical protein [Patescibacteria group bacterium]
MKRMVTISDVGRKFILTDPVEPALLKCRMEACRQGYPGHPDGCPKFKSCDCPPNAPWFGKLYEGPVRVAAVRFDFAGFITWRRMLQPTWTDKALRNPRHWQGHLAAALNRYLVDVELAEDEEIVFNPEAQGIDVTVTCATAGLKLEWPPRDKVCRVAMIAKRK